MTSEQGILGTAMSRREWPMPVKRIRAGTYVDLIPLSDGHVDDLWAVAGAAPDSFTYLRYGPFARPEDLRRLVADLSQRADQPFWAVVPKGQKPQGWLSICDVYRNDGSIEIGSIWFAPALQGSRAAREAIFMAMGQAMDDLGYERLVWRCQAQNAKSRRAAENFGFSFEGIWRRAAVVKGWQRDIAWFSIVRDEWPARRAALQNWLSPGNFDAAGRQLQPLSAFHENPRP